MLSRSLIFCVIWLGMLLHGDSSRICTLSPAEYNVSAGSIECRILHTHQDSCPLPGNRKTDAMPDRRVVSIWGIDIIRLKPAHSSNGK